MTGNAVSSVALAEDLVALCAIRVDVEDDHLVSASQQIARDRPAQESLATHNYSSRHDVPRRQARDSPQRHLA